MKNENGTAFVHIRCELESCKHNRKIIKEEIGQCTCPTEVIWRGDYNGECSCSGYKRE